MKQIRLRGITWNHSRAFPPLVAASQRFEEIHPGIEMVWDKRSLDEFGHSDLAALAGAYDLLIIDHPMMGEVHLSGTLADLRPLLAASALEQIKTDALGCCLASYCYENCLYALPIDAAAPAASFRADILDRCGFPPPAAWTELLDLGRRRLVRMPGFPADLFLNFMGMCLSHGSSVATGDHLFAPEIAARCLEELRELASFMPESIYSMNPIGLYQAMSSADEIAYCPFAYSYSNYARPGFADHVLQFANPAALYDGTPLRTVLGGTGIAVSARCTNMDAALDFCLFVISPLCQTALYGACGGQPASKTAWRDPLLNAMSNNFFLRTVAGIESAWIRPRYPGYIALQRDGGVPIADHLRGQISAASALQNLDDLYRKSCVTFARRDRLR